MSPTELIEHFDNKVLLHTYEIDSYAATLFWSKIKKVLSDINHEDAERVDWVDKLRVEGMKFRTSPYLPRGEFLKEIGVTSLAALARVWGADIGKSFSIIEKSRSYLESNTVLLHQLLAQTLLRKIEQYGLGEIRVYCHSREVELYKSLASGFNFDLKDYNFITSLSQYRVSDRFSTLFCVGPLKDFGWSRFPKVIINSPRYSELVQFLWKGYSMSPDFGLDPVFNDIDYLDRLFTTQKTVIADESKINLMQEEIDYEVGDIIEDQEIFRFNRRDNRENSRCCLIETNDGYGLLSAPRSNYIVFDDNGSTPSVFNEMTQNLIPGQFIVIHHVDIDVGKFFNYSKELSLLWKNALEEQYKYHWELLMAKLSNSDIDLKDLDGRVQDWIKSEGATIHAPRNKMHFKILIDEVLPEGILGGASWFDAWKEIEESRISAIAEGQQESELINQELLRKLKSKTQVINSLSIGNDYFRFQIDSGDGITGYLDFYKIKSLQKRYSAPREYFHTRAKLESFDVYREVT